MRALPLAAAVAAMVFMLACNDDKPKTQSKPPASGEPIPDDLVYNAGLDDKTTVAKAVVAIDGGGSASSAVGAGSTAKLLDAGADPKTPLVYAFSTKPRTVTATIKMSATNAPSGSPEQPPFKFTFTATPKPIFGLAGGSTIDIKVTKLEIVMPPNAPPQQAAGKDQLEKALVGVSGHFDASSHGDIDNLDFETAGTAQGVSEIVSIMQQALELLVVPVPNEPVGIGARWTKTENKRLADQGAVMSTTVTITLQSRDKASATLKVDATNTGTMAVNDPRAPKGTSVQRTTTASYTVIVRLDGVAQKVDGEAKNDVVQKVPGQQDQAMSVKLTQNLTSI
jgi:hypothetical protein